MNWMTKVIAVLCYLAAVYWIFLATWKEGLVIKAVYVALGVAFMMAGVYGLAEGRKK